MSDAPTPPAPTVRELREVKLFAPVAAWLKERGATKVLGEFLGHDMAALFPSHTECVELKLCLTRHLVRQGYGAAIAFSRVWLGVESRPRQAGLDYAQRMGLGVLRVVDGKVVVLVRPPESTAWPAMYVVRRKQIEQIEETDCEAGGLPCLAGDGPAQECASRVRRFLEDNPTATWREIFGKVPNHYSHHGSMAGALRDFVPRARIAAETRKEEDHA